MSKKAAKSIEFRVEIPKVESDFWTDLLKRDAEGQWTIADLDGFGGLTAHQIRLTVQSLISGEYVEQTGRSANPTGRGSKAMWHRLTKKPDTMPRLHSDGSEAGAPVLERLWRAMKMAKTFTAKSLAEMASLDSSPVDERVSGWYINQLKRVGVLALAQKRNRRHPPTYVLVQSSGMKPPTVFRTLIVLDPNTNTVVGDASLVEVLPL